MIAIVGGFLILFDSLSHLFPEKAPEFNRTVLCSILVFILLFVTLLAWIWISQILRVLAAGNAVENYYRAPTVFWWIRIFDLSIVIPLACISMYAFVTRKNSGGYGLLLLGVGSLLLAFPVVAGSQLYAYAMTPSLSTGIEIVFFVVLTVPIFPSYFYLVKGKWKTAG
jgi:succinate dehydrogenase/fumarate reductase cytochrome b subunit